MEDASVEWLSEVFYDADQDMWRAPQSEGNILLDKARQLIASEEWETAPASQVAQAALKWRKPEDREVASVALWTLIQQHGRLDVIHAAINEDVFRLSHALEPLFPALKLEPTTVVDLLVEIQEKSRGDLAAGMIVEMFEQWAKRHPHEAIKSLAGRPDLPPDAALVLSMNAVPQTLPPEDRTLISKAAAPDCASHTVFLGTMPELITHGFITRSKGMSLLEAGLFSDDQTASVAWFGLRRLLEIEICETAIQLVQRLVSDQRPFVHMILAQYLASTKQQKLHFLRRPLLFNAIATDSEFNSVIHQLDLLLAQTSDDDPDAVEEFLIKWIENHKKSDVRQLLKRTFRFTYHHVNSRNPKFWGNLAGRWLLTQPRLFNLSTTLFHEHSPDFGSLSPLTDYQFQRLTELILCTDLEGKNQLQLLGQLESMADSEGRVEALQSACHEIVVNYPGASQEFENSHRESHPLMAGALQSKREQYYPPREDKSALLEFSPPAERLEKWYRSTQRAERETWEQVEKNGDHSILELVSKVAVARGDGWSITQHDGSLGDVSPFSSFSYEMELPRFEILEPEDVVMRRLQRLQSAETEVIS